MCRFRPSRPACSPTAEIVHAVSDAVSRFLGVSLVVDPVSDGPGRAAAPNPVRAGCRLNTDHGFSPRHGRDAHAAEAEALRQGGSIGSAREAARRIRTRRRRRSSSRGGTWRRPGDRRALSCGDVDRLAAPRVDLGAIHGTGCTFASAIAAGLRWRRHPGRRAAREALHHRRD